MFQVILTVFTFLLLDALWLGVIATQFYINQFGGLMRMEGGEIQPNWFAAAVVYIALIVGILVFVIPKAHGNSLQALLWGGLFGLITYATYDFTNLSVLSEWPLKVCIVDTLWGMVLCGVTSFIAVSFAHR